MHNNDDRDARTILTGIAAAATSGPRIILAEIVLPAEPAPHVGYDLDMRIMAMGTGRERTLTAYDALLSGAGLSVAAVTSTPESFSIIDAQPPAPS